MRNRSFEIVNLRNQIKKENKKLQERHYGLTDISELKIEFSPRPPPESCNASLDFPVSPPRADFTFESIMDGKEEHRRNSRNVCHTTLLCDRKRNDHLLPFCLGPAEIIVKSLR